MTIREIWFSRDFNGEINISETKPEPDEDARKNPNKIFMPSGSGDGRMFKVSPSLAERLDIDHIELNKRYKVKDIVLEEVD